MVQTICKKSMTQETSTGIVIVGPLLACRRMRAQTEDRQFTGHEHLCNRLLVSTPLEVGAGMDDILPGPTGRSEQRIEALRIGSRISIWNNLSPRFSGLGGIRHPPLDQRRIKGYLELCD